VIILLSLLGKGLSGFGDIKLKGLLLCLAEAFVFKTPEMTHSE
jgi:hypothetical protein